MMNAIRNGNFTSSEIVALTGAGKREMTPSELHARPKTGKGSSAKLIEDVSIISDAALTYIDDCNMERRLGRSLTNELTARATSWGKLLERRVHELLGTSYQYCSSETLQHPDISCWVGSPDHIKHDEGKTVVDVKCPIGLKSFCNLVDSLFTQMDSDSPYIPIDAIRANHKDGEKYYWQLVSNAILTGAKFAELIVYMPYKSELGAIRELANNWDVDQKNYAWVNFAEDDELPYLNDGGFYSNLNIIRFTVPERDKIFLTQKVIAAEKLLINITPTMRGEKSASTAISVS